MGVDERGAESSERSPNLGGREEEEGEEGEKEEGKL